MERDAITRYSPQSGEVTIAPRVLHGAQKDDSASVSAITVLPEGAGWLEEQQEIPRVPTFDSSARNYGRRQTAT